MPLEKFYQELNDKIRDYDLMTLMSDPEGIVRYLAAFAPPADYQAPAGVSREDRTIDGPHGGIPIRIYRPESGAPSGVGLVWAHDGGWGAGSIDDPGSELFAREIVSRTSGVVVTLDYRLVGPDVRYPVPLDEYEAAFVWARDHRGELEIDPARLALGGGGCSANMSVATALRLRDGGQAGPSALVIPFSLLYFEVPEGTPEQQEKWQATIPSIISYTAPLVRFMYQNYTGTAIEESTDPYLTPAIADLHGLPRTLVITSEYDYLEPDGEAFAALLKAAGVEVTFREELGVEHAHLNHPWADGAQRSLDVIGEWLVSAPAKLASGASMTAS